MSQIKQASMNQTRYNLPRGTCHLRSENCEENNCQRNVPCGVYGGILLQLREKNWKDVAHAYS
jgi:hypothetical protein